MWHPFPDFPNRCVVHRWTHCANSHRTQKGDPKKRIAPAVAPDVMEKHLAISCGGPFEESLLASSHSAPPTLQRTFGVIGPHVSSKGAVHASLRQSEINHDPRLRSIFHALVQPIFHPCCLFFVLLLICFGVMRVPWLDDCCCLNFALFTKDK